jgi:hypothetical protein
VTIYLGPPGGLLALPSLSGPAAPLDLRAAVHQSLAGVRTVDRVGTPKRTYTFSRAALTADEWGLLEGLALGLYGPEPYVLVDPWRRNLLDENTSTAGGFLRDLTGLTVLGAGTLTLVGPVTTAGQGRYHASYASTASGAAGTQGVTTADLTSAATVTASATPVLPSASYTFQALVKTLAGTAASWRAAVGWYDSAGALLSTSTGTGSVVTGSWVARTVAATSPATAAYAVGRVENGATLAATNTVGVDAPMLDQAATVRAWLPGTGVPRVAFTDLGDVYRIGYEHDTAMTLVEVG